MSGRQIFSESEKICLQELIIRHKLNSVATSAAGNPNLKREAWARLVKEYNSIELNSKRTEAQLKKCWDNLKTRKKAVLAQEKRERMRTGGGPFYPKPGTSTEDNILIDEALVGITDTELRNVVDSDHSRMDKSQDIHFNPEPPNYGPPFSQMVTMPDGDPDIQSDVLVDTYPQQGTERDIHGRSGSRHTDYSATGQQIPGTAKNIRAKVISDEFNIRKTNYSRIQEREDDLHKLMVEEKQWLVKAAEEIYKRAVIERKSAEEVLRCNQLKREEAESKKTL